MSKTATVLSGLMKVYTIPCSDRGHINVMLVLQSCSNSLHILPGSSSETNATSDGVCNFSNIEVEDNAVDVIEEDFKVIHEEVNVGIKQEEIPGDITFPDIKSEPDEVSYMYMSVIGHILPVFKYSIYQTTCTDLGSFRRFLLMFLSTIGGQQSNLVCYHYDTLACNASRFPTGFCCL
jgi:hypothetical protein